MSAETTPEPGCASCIHLHECKEVTEQKILDEYYCRLWQAAPINALEARRDIMEELGPWALRYETLDYKNRTSARPKRKYRRRKRHV